MSFNILDAADSYLSPALIAKASLYLDETDDGIERALSGIVPIVLSGYVTKSNLNSANANDILLIVKNTYKEDVFKGLETLMSRRKLLLDKGLILVQSLFGEKFDNLIHSITSFAGIKQSSATSLFSLGGLLLGSLLGKFVKDLNLSSTRLSSFLHGQKINIMSVLPADLSRITGLLGLSELGETFTLDRKQILQHAAETFNKPKYKINWRLWLSALVVVALIVWFFIAR